MTYALIGIATIAGFFISSAILLVLSKLFRITNASYKKSILICFLTVISSSLITTILLFIGFGMLSQILSTVITFFIFSYLFKRHYQASWKKALGVYVANIVVGAIITLVVVVPIRLFVAEPFVIAGQSMSPNLNPGDYLIINKLDRNYKRDDVIVFKSSSGQAYLIKRIIGLPTEKITIHDGIIKINGSEFTSQNISGKIEGDLDVVLAADEFFVLGDNVVISAMDSRKIGPVKKVDIKGKVI